MFEFAKVLFWAKPSIPCDNWYSVTGNQIDRKFTICLPVAIGQEASCHRNKHLSDVLVEVLIEGEQKADRIGIRGGAIVVNFGNFLK